MSTTGETGNAMKYYIAPSLLSADFGKLGEEIRTIEEAGADLLHIDVMDGRFVPNITVGPVVVEAIKKYASIPLDVHLMIVEPEKYIDAFAEAGADIITVHAEATPHLQRVVARIRDLGKKAGVSINPSTPLSAVRWVLRDVGMVLIMSVNPGFGGQTFIKASIDKIERLRARIRKAELDVDIQVDGGIKVDNIGEVAAAGANVIVAGSGIFGTPDYKETIRLMRKEIQTTLGMKA